MYHISCIIDENVVFLTFELLYIHCVTGDFGRFSNILTFGFLLKPPQSLTGSIFINMLFVPLLLYLFHTSKVFI